MDMNERVMRQDDYVELLEKIRKVDILAMKQDVEEHFAALDVGADLVEELVKNVFIKQVLVIEDHQRRQTEGFTIVEVLDACNAAVIDEVLDFINTQVTVTADNSDVVKAILDSLAPGAKVSPEDLETTTLVVRPAVVSLEELAGPNGAEALRRVSEQATINGLIEAGAIPLGFVGHVKENASVSTSSSGENAGIILEDVGEVDVSVSARARELQLAYEKSVDTANNAAPKTEGVNLGLAHLAHALGNTP